MAVNLNAAGSPTTRGWGAPGRTPDQLTRIKLAGSDALPIRVDSRIAPLVQRLVDGLVAIRAAAGKPPLTSSGGYNLRKIAGTDTWSNHSWALAVDFNAAANPYAINGGTDFPVNATRALANVLGFRWGYDYVTGKRDAMHFEYMGTPSDATTLIANLDAADLAAKNTTPLEGDDMKAEHEKMLEDLYVQVCGQKSFDPATRKFGPFGWPQLGGVTLVDAIAKIKSKVGA